MNILITGASLGLGKQFANVCAQNKNNIVIVARNKEKLYELKSEIESKYNVKVYVCTADLSKTNRASEVYQFCKKNNIHIDALINNAGGGGQGEFVKRELQKDLDMINLNIISVVQLMHLFAQDFIKNKSGKF